MNNNIIYDRKLYNKISNVGNFFNYYVKQKYVDIPKYYSEFNGSVDKRILESIDNNNIKESYTFDKNFVNDNQADVQKFEFVPLEVNSAPPTPIDDNNASQQRFNVGSNRFDWMRDFRRNYDEFYRGIIMYDAEGKEVIDIFDNISKHHAQQTRDIARDEFGVIINDTGTPMGNAEEVNKQGLTVAQLEGQTFMLFLPENLEDLSVKMLEELMVQIDRRSEYDFYVAINGRVASLANYAELGLDEGQWRQEDLLDYLEELRKAKLEKMENDSLMSRDEYIKELINYVVDNHMTIDEYYARLATTYRKGNQPEENFEKYNPFLNDNDIKLLCESNDENIENHFVRAMSRVIEMNIRNMYDVEETREENQDDENKEIDRTDVSTVNRLTNHQYIATLLNYVRENNTSIEEYYRALGNNYRNNMEYVPLNFEIGNPFLTPRDIELLRDSDDEDIVEHFVSAMSRVISMNMTDDEKIAREVGSEQIKDSSEEAHIDRDDIERTIQEALDRMENSDLDEETHGEIVGESGSERIKDSSEEAHIDRDDIERTIQEALDRMENSDVEEETHGEIAREDIERTIQEALDRIENQDEKDKEDSDKIIENTDDEEESSDKNFYEKHDDEFTDKEKAVIREVNCPININVLDDLNGFAVIREQNVNRVNVYTYNASNKDNLNGRRTFTNSRIQSGYYVNINQFINTMLNELNSQYENIESINFIDENNNIKNFDIVMEEVLAICKIAGGIKVGEDISSTKITSYKQLSELYDETEYNFNDCTLYGGYFVRKDVLENAFSKYKFNIKVREIQNDSEDGLKWPSSYSEEQILDAISRGIYEPAGPEFEQWCREVVPLGNDNSSKTR